MTRHVLVPLVKWVMLGCLFLTGPLLSADTFSPQDFSTTNTDWNGYSTLSKIFNDQGLSTAQIDVVDWDKTTSKDVLFITQPLRAVAPWKELYAFVQQGGHVVVADESGQANPFFMLLGHEKSDQSFFAPKGTSPFPEAPLATRTDLLPSLTRYAPTLWANRPHFFKHSQKDAALYVFDNNHVLANAKDLGKGRAIALADSSLFLNQMLELEGNLAFAINIAKTSAQAQKTNVLFMANTYKTSGTPFESNMNATISTTLFRARGSINHALKTLNDYLITTRYALLLSTFLAFVLIVQLMRKPFLSPHSKRETTETEQLKTTIKETIIIRWTKKGLAPAHLLRDKDSHPARFKELGASLSNNDTKMLASLFDTNSKHGFMLNNKQSDWLHLLEKIS